MEKGKKKKYGKWLIGKHVVVFGNGFSTRAEVVSHLRGPIFSIMSVDAGNGINLMLLNTDEDTFVVED
jgi:hypothetical protein